MAHTCIHKYKIYETCFAQKHDYNPCQTTIAQTHPKKTPAITWQSGKLQLRTDLVQRVLEPASALLCGVPGYE